MCFFMILWPFHLCVKYKHTILKSKDNHQGLYKFHHDSLSACFICKLINGVHSKWFEGVQSNLPVSLKFLWFDSNFWLSFGWVLQLYNSHYTEMINSAVVLSRSTFHPK